MFQNLVHAFANLFGGPPTDVLREPHIFHVDVAIEFGLMFMTTCVALWGVHTLYHRFKGAR